MEKALNECAISEKPEVKRFRQVVFE